MNADPRTPALRSALETVRTYDYDLAAEVGATTVHVRTGTKSRCDGIEVSVTTPHWEVFLAAGAQGKVATLRNRRN